jgi:RNA polymerase sigma-70 factor (ECF subfamily)
MAADAATRERDLIRRLRAGDRSGLEGLVDQYGEPLMRYLVSIVGDRDAGEDVFQDTWVRVAQSARRCNPRRPFAPWLFRIARNLAYDRLRWRRRWGLLSLTADEDRIGAGVLPVAPVAAERTSVRDLAGKLLARLEPRYREVIWLRFYRDCSYEEIAAICGLRPGTVKSRLHRALDRLATLHTRLTGRTSEEKNDVGADA